MWMLTQEKALVNLDNVLDIAATRAGDQIIAFSATNVTVTVCNVPAGMDAAQVVARIGNALEEGIEAKTPIIDIDKAVNG